MYPLDLTQGMGALFNLELTDDQRTRFTEAAKGLNESSEILAEGLGKRGLAGAMLTMTAMAEMVIHRNVLDELFELATKSLMAANAKIVAKNNQWDDVIGDKE